jgi:hypothetical protein
MTTKLGNIARQVAFGLSAASVGYRAREDGYLVVPLPSEFGDLEIGTLMRKQRAKNPPLNLSGLSGANHRSRLPDHSGVRRWARLNRRNKAAFAVGRIRITALAAVKVAHDRGYRQAVDQNGK